jgi:hypothetical protein
MDRRALSTGYVVPHVKRGVKFFWGFLRISNGFSSLLIGFLMDCCGAVRDWIAAKYIDIGELLRFCRKLTGVVSSDLGGENRNSVTNGIKTG